MLSHRAPTLSLDQLHVRRLHEDGEREDREERVCETDAAGPNHSAIMERASWRSEAESKAPAGLVSECAC